MMTDAVVSNRIDMSEHVRAADAGSTAPRTHNLPEHLRGLLDPAAYPHVVARVELVETAELANRVSGAAPLDAGRESRRVGVYSRVVPAAGWLHRTMPAEAEAAARDLFAALRGFDAQGVEAIWVEQPPAGPDWDGVRDRLQRAAVPPAP